jgi:hypothetical protein
VCSVCVYTLMYIQRICVKMCKNRNTKTDLGGSEQREGADARLERRDACVQCLQQLVALFWL